MKSKRQLAKTVHLHLGAPALGGKMSLTSSKNNILEVTPEGIRAISVATKRSVLLPYSNIVDVELVYVEDDQSELSK